MTLAAKAAGGTGAATTEFVYVEGAERGGQPIEGEERELTRAEKWLAFGLVAFLLLGGTWILRQMGGLVPHPNWEELRATHRLDELEPPYWQAQAAHQAAINRENELLAAVNDARQVYEFRREEYRVSLDRGIDDPELRALHEAARADLESAQVRLEVAQAVTRARAADLEVAGQPFLAAQQALEREFSRQQSRRELHLLLLRGAYALPLFGASLLAWKRLRRRGGAWTLLATSFAAFAGLQTLLLVGQYSWHLFRNYVQLAVSVFGAAATTAAIIGLRRLAFTRDRLVRARFWRGRCPHCGFPGRAARFCAHCGQPMQAACGACGEPRLVMAPYCGHCGTPAA
ncbi:MAG TPA: hypothetical protein DEQ28_01090 [Clostridiales bacterium]|nr:hypothetical protein [Clostridiales bacterium]